MAPCYISAMIHRQNTDPAEYWQRLRSSSDQTRLIVSRSFKRAGDMSFTIAAARLWNDLPVYLCESHSLSMFKRQLNSLVSIIFVLCFSFFFFCKALRSSWALYKYFSNNNNNNNNTNNNNYNNNLVSKSKGHLLEMGRLLWTTRYHSDSHIFQRRICHFSKKRKNKQTLSRISFHQQVFKGPNNFQVGPKYEIQSSTKL